MPYEVELRHAARRALERLPGSIQERIIRKLEALADEPRPPGAVMLQGASGFLRVRVSDYRIVYDVRDDDLQIMVEMIGHHREVYRHLK